MENVYNGNGKWIVTEKKFGEFFSNLSIEGLN